MNNVWGGYAAYHEDRFGDLDGPFWTSPLSVWDDMFVAGVRAHYVASALGVPLMVAGGLIVNISFFPGTYSATTRSPTAWRRPLTTGWWR